MKYRLLDDLVCPACKRGRFTVESLEEVQVRIWDSHFVDNPKVIEGVDLRKGFETEILEGVLHCIHCTRTFNIRNGIPRMILDESAPFPSAHRMTRIRDLNQLGALEENFTELQSPLTKHSFLGRKVMDVGCGYGRHTYFAARYGAEVYAIDYSDDAVETTKVNTQQFQHVHVIQADAAHLPFREGCMDRVFTFGVLHHVENPSELMKEAHRVLSSGGSLGLWVYGPRQGLTLQVNNALRGMTTHMSHDDLLKFSRLLASGVRVGSHTPYRLFRALPIAHSIVSHLPLHDHHQWPFEIVVAECFSISLIFFPSKL